MFLDYIFSLDDICLFPPLSPLYSFLSVTFCHSQHDRTRRRRRQRSLVRYDHRWAARRVPTLHPTLPWALQRNSDKRLASVCWLLRRLPRFARTQPQRAQTASKFTSLRPRLVSERNCERGPLGWNKGQISVSETPGERRGSFCNVNEPSQWRWVRVEGEKSGKFLGLEGFDTFIQ